MSSKRAITNSSSLKNLSAPSSLSPRKAEILTKALVDNLSEDIKNSSSVFDSNVIEKAEQYTNSTGSWLWYLLRIFFIILILAFLGFNIFAYLGLITGKTADYLKPLLEYLGYPIVDTTKQTLRKSIEGTKDIIDIAAVGADTTLDTLEKSLDGKSDIMTSLNNAKSRIDKKRSKTKNLEVEKEPKPDESGSSTQITRRGKAGFCYIGEDRGNRSCIEVGVNDECMSGNIFPSRDICINPNLRI